MITTEELKLTIKGHGDQNQLAPNPTAGGQMNSTDLYSELKSLATSGIPIDHNGKPQYSEAVKKLQASLMFLGIPLPTFGADGYYGQETANSLEQFKNTLAGREGSNTESSPTIKTSGELNLTIKTPPAVSEQINTTRISNFSTFLKKINESAKTKAIDSGLIDMLINHLKSKNAKTEDVMKHLTGSTGFGSVVSIANKIISYFVKKGLTPEQAAGIAGNLYQESKFNPTIFGDNGAAYGLAQWRDSRLSKLKSVIPNWNTLEGQLDFIWHELNSTEANAKSQLLAARTPEEAAIAFSSKFERPNVPNNAQRASNAKSMLSNYQA